MVNGAEDDLATGWIMPILSCLGIPMETSLTGHLLWSCTPKLLSASNESQMVLWPPHQFSQELWLHNLKASLWGQSILLKFLLCAVSCWIRMFWMILGFPCSWRQCNFHCRIFYSLKQIFFSLEIFAKCVIKNSQWLKGIISSRTMKQPSTHLQGNPKNQPKTSTKCLCMLSISHTYTL